MHSDLSQITENYVHHGQKKKKLIIFEFIEMQVCNLQLYTEKNYDKKAAHQYAINSEAKHLITQYFFTHC
jgi:hypothetical protein